MRRIALLHEDARVRELYRAVLDAQGYGVLAATVASGVTDPDVASCDLLIVQVTDGRVGVDRLVPLVAAGPASVVGIDDDPDPARDRRLLALGVATVLPGPVSLRTLVDTVRAELPLEGPGHDPDSVRSARIRHDSASLGTDRHLRGEVDRGGRHLLLSSDGLDIALHCFPRAGAVRVRGTVLGATEPVLARVLLTHPNGTAETRTDVTGRFGFERVPTGPSTLDIRGRGWSVRADVDLEAA